MYPDKPEFYLEGEMPEGKKVAASEGKKGGRLVPSHIVYCLPCSLVVAYAGLKRSRFTISPANPSMPSKRKFLVTS